MADRFSHANDRRQRWGRCSRQSLQAKERLMHILPLMKTFMYIECDMLCFLLHHIRISQNIKNAPV